MSEQETAISISCPSSLSFSQNQPMKFEILTILASVQSNWHNFSWTELENKSQFSPKLFMPLQCHNMKPPATVFGRTIVPFRQNNPIKFEIFTSWHAGTKLGEFFSGLNWKSGVSFTPNLLWAFQCLKIKPLLQFFVEPMYLPEKTK